MTGQGSAVDTRAAFMMQRGLRDGYLMPDNPAQPELATEIAFRD